MKCKICGNNSESEYCFKHKPKKKLNVGVKKVKKTNECRELFLHIWKFRKHVSEVSGEYLGAQPLSVYFHHILPKEKFPDAELDKDNIILLTLDEHTNVENDMFRYAEVNARRELLLKKYNLL